MKTAPRDPLKNLDEIPDCSEEARNRLERFLTQYRGLLVDAVADRLAGSQRTVSDLSGGLDSSASPAS